METARHRKPRRQQSATLFLPVLLRCCSSCTTCCRGSSTSCLGSSSHCRTGFSAADGTSHSFCVDGPPTRREDLYPERGSVRVPNRRCGVPFNRLLRRRSAWVVGTCCTRPWRLGTCVRSERLATVPSWTVCLSCLTDDPELSGPVALGPGVLALVSGQSGSPTCSFLDSVLEPFTDDPPVCHLTPTSPSRPSPRPSCCYLSAKLMARVGYSDDLLTHPLFPVRRTHASLLRSLASRCRVWSALLIVARALWELHADLFKLHWLPRDVPQESLLMLACSLEVIVILEARPDDRSFSA